MREHSGWVWTLINGIAALVLGIMVYNRWPSNSAWVLGLLYGINGRIPFLKTLHLVEPSEIIFRGGRWGGP